MNNIETYKDYISKINEGLIKTHDIDKSMKIINNFLLNKNIVARINGVYKTSDFNVEFDITKEIIKDFFGIISNLKQLTINLGYFPSLIIFRKKKSFINKIFKKEDELVKTIDDSFNDIEISKYDLISIYYESKYDRIVKNNPTELYHVYNKNIKDKIIKNGLIPKNKNKDTYHPERIYFVYTIEDALNLKRIFEKKHNQESEILKIFINKKNNFYEDPRGGYDMFGKFRCIYTYDNISPKNIKFLTEENINDYLSKQYFKFKL